MTPLDPRTRPVGVFDSGVGGLSVLRALQAELPHEHFVYIADSGHAPYGEREVGHVIARSSAIAHALIEQHQVKAVVVACNTATALAIAALRLEFPCTPFIGVEPALKPAALTSVTGHVGVLATRGTLASDKFRSLLNSMPPHATYACQACDGLADAIEQQDTIKIVALCRNFIGTAGRFGTESTNLDTLVLGCTHYPFAAAVIRDILGPNVTLIESGPPVARQTRRVLGAMLNSGTVPGTAVFYTSGNIAVLKRALLQWMSLQEPTVFGF